MLAGRPAARSSCSSAAASAQLLASTQGGRKAVGDRKFYAVLNQVDTPELQQQGIQIQQLLRQQGIQLSLIHI